MGVAHKVLEAYIPDAEMKLLLFLMGDGAGGDDENLCLFEDSSFAKQASFTSEKLAWTMRRLIDAGWIMQVKSPIPRYPICYQLNVYKLDAAATES